MQSSCFPLNEAFHSTLTLDKYLLCNCIKRDDRRLQAVGGESSELRSPSELVYFELPLQRPVAINEPATPFSWDLDF